MIIYILGIHDVGELTLERVPWYVHTYHTHVYTHSTATLPPNNNNKNNIINCH